MQVRYLLLACTVGFILTVFLFMAPRHETAFKLEPTKPKPIVPAEPVVLGTLPAEEVPEPDASLDENGRMLKRIAAVKRVCGKLCDSKNEGTPSKFFNNIRVPVNCKAIFQEALIDAPREQKAAPTDVPKEYYEDFTMHGRFPMKRYQTFFDEVYLTGNAAENRWTKEFVEQWKDQANHGHLPGTYGVETTNALMAALKALGMKGKRCLVIGSERPWVEAALLAAGAEHVVTLEYGKIFSTHPQVSTMLPSEFTAAYLNGTLGLFDSVVTISSVEHAGLGRYGDALLPWGDILAIARGWCVTKPKGDLVLSVPVGPDAIMFNAHRQYGPVRFPHVAANWEQVARSKDEILTFRKQDPIS